MGNLVGVPHPGGIHIILMVKQTTRRMSCLVFLTFVASVLTVGQAQLLLDNMFRFPRPGFEGEIRSKKPLQRDISFTCTIGALSPPSLRRIKSRACHTPTFFQSQTELWEMSVVVFLIFL